MTPRHKPRETCSGCPLEPAGSDFSQPEGTGRLRAVVPVTGDRNGPHGVGFRAMRGGIRRRNIVAH